MKTGIITFHQALNYGAVLQTYALQKTLQKMGIECEVIDYSCERINEDYKAVALKKCKSKKDYLRTIPFFLRMSGRRKAFRKFVKKYLTLSEACDRQNIKLVGNKYDCLITGSDQVFNDKCTDLDYNYFLAFAEDNHKKNSYAASFGFQKVPEGKEKEYEELLSTFENISVREEKGIDIVRNVTGRQAIRNVDPTLILTAEDWKETVGDRPFSEKYIFMYTVMEPVQGFNFAKKLADEKGLKLIYLHGTIELREKAKNEPNVKHIYSLSPDEFITYVYHAEYVITNSFHGTVFSIIFKKKFAVELETGWSYNHRSEELVHLLGLEKRILNNGCNDDIDQVTDWKDVDLYLENESRRSNEYLRTIITK